MLHLTEDRLFKFNYFNLKKCTCLLNKVKNFGLTY